MRINNGIVKELYDNGLVKFEGKYYNGKKLNGKGYTYYGIKIYEINNGLFEWRKKWRWKRIFIW